jgi:hypothetical protein
MKKFLAFNADGTGQLIIVKGVFRKHFYHVVPGVGLVELHVEQL